MGEKIGEIIDKAIRLIIVIMLAFSFFAGLLKSHGISPMVNWSWTFILAPFHFVCIMVALLVFIFAILEIIYNY